MTPPQVSLRRWTLTDAPTLAIILNNKNIQDNLDKLPFPYTEKDAEAYIKSVLNAETGSIYAFAILYDGVVVGNIGFHRQTTIYRYTGQMGYYIAEPYWGKGIATEAVKQAIDFIFTHTDLVKIVAELFIYNKPSIRVLEKAGFFFEGILLKNAFKNGQFYDIKRYALIKECKK